MDLFVRLLSSMFLFIIVVGANHDSTLEPQLYWRTVLPHTPMPSAIAQLLQPGAYDEKPGTSVHVGKGGVNVDTGKGTSVNVGKGGVNVDTGKGTSVNVGHGGVNVHTGKGTSVAVGHGGDSKPPGTSVNVNTGPAHKPGGTTVNVGKGGVGVAVKPKGKPVVVNVSPYIYNYAATDTQARDDPAAALFFLRQDLRSGKKFNLRLSQSTSGRSSFIPRSEAEAIPFSSAELHSVLPRFGVPAGSAEAEEAEKTVGECEEAAAAGEKKVCATSLEAMVDFATESLGTRDVVAVGTEGRRENGVYEVEKVRRVGGDEGVVACHPEVYAYAVFFCHATEKAEVYEVEMEGVKAVAVCHTDTAGWNPKHLAFRVLKVKPGTVPVCHFLPRDHVVWAAGRV